MGPESTVVRCSSVKCNNNISVSKETACRVLFKITIVGLCFALQKGVSESFFFWHIVETGCALRTILTY